MRWTARENVFREILSKFVYFVITRNLNQGHLAPSTPTPIPEFGRKHAFICLFGWPGAVE